MLSWLKANVMMFNARCMMSDRLLVKEKKLIFFLWEKIIQIIVWSYNNDFFTTYYIYNILLIQPLETVHYVGVLNIPLDN